MNLVIVSPSVQASAKFRLICLPLNFFTCIKFLNINFDIGDEYLICWVVNFWISIGLLLLGSLNVTESY